MDLDTLGALIRDDDPTGPSPTTVDRLVTGALHRGRRRRTGHRFAAGMAACALLVTGVAVVTQWPGRAVEVGPVAPTVTLAPTAAARPSGSLTPSTSGGPTSRGVKPPSGAEVLALFKAKLPRSFTYSQIDTKIGMAGEASVAFTVKDTAGRAFVGGGIYNKFEGLDCPPDSCVEEPLADGTVLVMRDPKGEKAGEGAWYYFQRADGSWIWLGQRNAFQGNGPVTRPAVPLSETEVRRLLTAPEWDPLVKRCRTAGSAC